MHTFLLKKKIIKKMKEFRNLAIPTQCMLTSTCTFCTILYIQSMYLWINIVQGTGQKYLWTWNKITHCCATYIIYTHSIFTIQDVTFSENKMKDIFNAVCWYFLHDVYLLMSLLNFQLQFFYWHWSTSYKNMLHVLIYSHAIHMCP